MSHAARRLHAWLIFDVSQMKRLVRWLAALLGILSLSHAANFDTSVVAKIVVRADGTLLFDGRKVEIRDLNALLTPIKEKNGVVWYYRANPQSDPPPKAMEVLKVIMAKELPIKLFSKEDFSESIDADGRPHREKKG